MIIKLPWFSDLNDLTAFAEDLAVSCEAIVEEEMENRTREVAEKAVSAFKAEIADGLTITSILANHKKNAFTVVWADGTSTVIHCQPGDKWDDEKALAMCFVKKIAGNKGNFNDIFTEIMPAKIKRIGSVEEPETEKEPIPAVTPSDTSKNDTNCKKTLSIIPEGKWHVVDRLAKVGDYICLQSDGGFSFSKPGDILRVDVKKDDCAGVFARNHPRNTGNDDFYVWWYSRSEYKVVEPIESIGITQAERDNNNNVITDDMVLFTKTAKTLGRKLKQAGDSAVKSSGALHEMAVALAGDTLTKDPIKDTKTYNLYLGHTSPYTKWGSDLSAKDIVEKIWTIIHDSFPECEINPLRAWCDNGTLTVDFGRSSYFLIPGMTMDEWVSQYR